MSLLSDLINDWSRGQAASKWGSDWMQKIQQMQAQTRGIDASTQATQANTEYIEEKTKTEGLQQKEIQAKLDSTQRAIDAAVKAGYLSPEERDAAMEKAKQEAEIALKKAQIETEKMNPALRKAQISSEYAQADANRASAEFNRRRPAYTGRPYPAVINGELVMVDPATREPIEGMQPMPTQEWRNRQDKLGLAGKSIQLVKNLGDKIITRVGPAQRVAAIERGAEAVFGSDPEFRAYQDARMALAGNLAVAQQGSRPSDADIKAIWLPLVPDVYRDTRESAALKWNMIDIMSGTNNGGAAPDKLDNVLKELGF